MNALSLFILALLIAVVLATPRRLALLGMAAGVLYLTQNVFVNVAGFNMFAMRFLEIAGFARVMARREFSFSSLNGMDRLLLLFYSYLTIVFLLRSNEGQAYQIGLAVDATFCYFTFRGLVRDMDDFCWFLRAFVILLIPYVGLLFVEMHTAHNPFSALGVGASTLEVFRNGRVRCQGSFRESSLLGTMGASFLPLYIGLCFSKNMRIYALFGIVLCLAVVWFSNSGGPMAFAGIGVLGWLLWSHREKMRLLRRVGFAGIAAMGLVMKAPIWYLPTKISFLTGGDAWHRSYLMNLAAQHISEWWFWGMPFSKTSNWFPYTLANGDADITNQFVSFGLAAGLMAIVIFALLLIRVFKDLGKEMAVVRTASTLPSEAEHVLWGLGVMLAGHIANFTAITYFDQTYVIWFLQLAAISSLTQMWGYASVPVASTQTNC